MAEKGSPGCAASVGCTLLQTVMSHSKGGSENVCVNYDTSTALALSILEVVLQRCSRAYIFLFFSPLVLLWSVNPDVLNVYVVNAILQCRNIRIVFVGLLSEDVCECMLVAPPTEWVCVALWLIPPLQRLDGIQHTITLDRIHHADRSSAQNSDM